MPFLEDDGLDRLATDQHAGRVCMSVRLTQIDPGVAAAAAAAALAALRGAKAARRRADDAMTVARAAAAAKAEDEGRRSASARRSVIPIVDSAQRFAVAQRAAETEAWIETTNFERTLSRSLSQVAPTAAADRTLSARADPTLTLLPKLAYYEEQPVAVSVLGGRDVPRALEEDECLLGLQPYLQIEAPGAAQPVEMAE